MTGIEERLLAAGLLPAEARRKRELFEQVEEARMQLSGGASPRGRWFVPGRLEVLGKRAGESGGRALLCAVGRGHCVAASPRRDALLRVFDAGRGLATEARLDGRTEAEGADWTSLVQAVASRVVRRFPELRGADVAFASDLPRASGLASSSALVASIVAVLADFNELGSRPEWAAVIRGGEDLAGFLDDVESGCGFGGPAGVDTTAGTGGADPAAIVCGQAGRILQLAFGPLRVERTVPLDGGWRFVVAASGVVRGVRDQPALAATEILAVWNRSTGRRDATLFEALSAGPDASARIRALVRVLPASLPNDVLLRRFDQFVEETFALVPHAADFLESGEVGRFGELVERSQALAETHLADPSPETIALARSARELGAMAATAVGAGSGEGAWALTRTEDADAFRRRWAERYASTFPAVAGGSRFFVTRPGPAMTSL